MRIRMTCRQKQLRFVLWLLQKYSDEFAKQPEDLARKFAILTACAEAARAMDEVLELEFRQFIRNQCENLLQLYLRFLTLYLKAGGVWRPKCHLLVHMIQRALHRGNPRLYSTYRDESLNGIIAKNRLLVLLIAALGIILECAHHMTETTGPHRAPVEDLLPDVKELCALVKEGVRLFHEWAQVHRGEDLAARAEELCEDTLKQLEDSMNHNEDTVDNVYLQLAEVETLVQEAAEAHTHAWGQLSNHSRELLQSRGLVAEHPREAITSESREGAQAAGSNKSVAVAKRPRFMLDANRRVSGGDECRTKHAESLGQAGHVTGDHDGHSSNPCAGSVRRKRLLLERQESLTAFLPEDCRHGICSRPSFARPVCPVHSEEAGSCGFDIGFGIQKFPSRRLSFVWASSAQQPCSSKLVE
eukprot:s4351_g3.t1